MSETDGGVQIWVMDLATGDATQLTFEGTENRYPVWTRDGREVLFTSKRGDVFAIYRKAADGTGEATRVLDGTDQLVATDVLPGNVLLYQDKGEDRGRDILTFDLERSGPATPFLATSADEYGARASPDGAWVTYVSNEAGGDNRIYIRPYPVTGGGGQRVVSGSLSVQPVWSRRGDEVLFIGPPPNSPLMFAPITSSSTSLTPGRPQKLFAFIPAYEFRSFLNTAPYDVLPNGDVIAVRPFGSAADDDQAAAARPTAKVVLNWFQDLERLAPTK